MRSHDERVAMYKKAGLQIKHVAFDVDGTKDLDSNTFVRMTKAGFILIQPNGEEHFITDEALDALVDFQRDCFAKEGK